jgi:hypothetical protein
MKRFTSLIAIGLATSLHAEGATLLKRDADQLRQKISAINLRATATNRRPARTTVTEPEVNAYLAFEAGTSLPAGVVDPAVGILGSDRVTARAVVDLDRVRQQRNPASLLDPVRFLRGRLTVNVTGLVHASDGVGRFEFEAADIAGVPIPKYLVQQIVSYYSRSPQRPDGYDLDDPVALPARIQQILVQRGQAIVVQ